MADGAKPEDDAMRDAKKTALFQIHDWPMHLRDFVLATKPKAVELIET